MAYKFYLKILSTAILLLQATFAYTQTDTSFLRHSASSLEKWTTSNPQEKVYLHLDKTQYDLYDTLWYKAYTVAGEHHQLSAISGVLYVELISPKDSVITRQILYLTAGIGWGDIPLPVNIKAGDFYIRAYTNWMRNAGPEYFYRQKIHIGNQATALVNKQPANLNPDVQFFPEGGYLVNGLRSRIAVKAVNVNGLGQDIKGTIEDNEGNVVVDFATQHLGLGVFAFAPQIGKTYNARIITGDAKFMVNLPKANDRGFTLSVNNSNPDSVFLRMAADSTTFNTKKLTGFYIIGQCNGKIYYSATGKLNEHSFSAVVDKRRFPGGITQFTLFSDSGEPLNERTVFIENNRLLKLRTSSILNNYTPRQKVNISFDAVNDAEKPVVGSFLVSVINESLAPVDESADNTIEDYLLLTADLNGYVEQPNYYFTNPDEKTKANLDILMLTQGYQRFEWKQILKDSIPLPQYQPESLLTLSGTVKNLSGKAVPNGKVTFIATKNSLIADTVTDANGKFTFTGIDLPDSVTIVINAKDAKNRNDVIPAIVPTTYPPVIKNGWPVSIADTVKNATPVSTAINNYQEQKALQLKNRHQLKEVVIKSHKTYKRPELDLENSDNLNGPGHANQVIMGDTLKGCPVLSTCLARVATTISFKHGAPVNNRNLDYMLLIVDGAVRSGDDLNDFDANLIQSIEVLQSKAYTAIYGDPITRVGALVITTKRGSNYAKAYKHIPGTLQFTFHGFYKAHEFYSPKYDAPKINAQASDLRSTIYWDPNIITDKDGKASFEFFNADTKGTYRVVIEGIDDDGNLGRVVYRYKVE